MNKIWWNEWRPAVMWGLKIALAHRLALLVWMALIWVAVGQPLNIPIGLHVDPIAQLPTLSPLEQVTLGVWRRWDASHYLNLAQNGYRASDPGPTVFGVLTPTGIKAFDVLLPGGVDFGGMVFGTVAFWLALAMLYRVCEVYYGDSDLGRWAAVMLAILPHAFFFSAPMSEAIYLALALGVFYAGAKKQWLLAALFGSIATLARHQGILMAGIIALMIFQESMHRFESWRPCIVYCMRHSIWLIFMAAAFGGYMLFRQRLGLPSLGDTYIAYSFSYIADPLTGLMANVKWVVENPLSAVVNPDLWALVVSSILTIIMWRKRGAGYGIFSIYIVLYTVLFISRVNYVWGGYEQTTNTQSFARYSLAFFPLTILIADMVRGASRRIQIAAIGLLVGGLLLFSALFTLGGGAP